MKRIVILFLFLLTLHCFSQTPSKQTKSHVHRVVGNDLNKHFIRFVFFASLPPIDNVASTSPNYSISLEKLAPPNHKTEPLDKWLNYPENNMVVDTSIYLLFKNYILLHENELSKHYYINHHDYSILEINIDFQHRYYLNKQQSVSFLSAFDVYLESKKIDLCYYDPLVYITLTAPDALDPLLPVQDPN